MRDLLPLFLLFRELEVVPSSEELHRVVFLCQESGIDFDLRFSMNRGGPLSDELDGHMAWFLECGTIEAVRVDGTFRGYRLSARALSALQRIAQLPPTWAARAREIAQNRTLSRKYVCSILFLISRGWSGDSLRERFCALFPEAQNEFAAHVALAITVPENALRKVSS